MNEFLTSIRRSVEYVNATMIRSENKRFVVVSLDSGNYGIELNIITYDLKPRAVHKVIRNKVVSTSFKLSQEGAMALYLALGNQLKRDNLL